MTDSYIHIYTFTHNTLISAITLTLTNTNTITLTNIHNFSLSITSINNNHNNVLIPINPVPNILHHYDRCILPLIYLLHTRHPIHHIRTHHHIRIHTHQLHLSQTLPLLNTTTHLHLLPHHLTQHPLLHLLLQLLHYLQQRSQHLHPTPSQLNICSISSHHHINGFPRTILILATIHTHLTHHDHRLFTLLINHYLRTRHLRWWQWNISLFIQWNVLTNDLALICKR